MLKRLVLRGPFREGKAQVNDYRSFHSEKCGDAFEDPENKEPTLDMLPV